LPDSTPRDPATPPSPLVLRGGVPGAVLPFLVFLAGVAWLGISGAPDERGFWPILVAALGVGLLLARDGERYADVVFRGMSRPVVMVMVMAWLLAGMFGAVLKASGLVEGLVWVAEALDLGGASFLVATFSICCLVSTATGTSLGTLILAVPLLYPAGVTLGAAPAVLMGTILGGATFGDNLSPVSDTTIASASSQGADLGGVVRSRLRYALPAAGLAVVATLWLQNGAAVGVGGSVVSAGDPRGLPMLLSPALVFVVLLRGRQLLEGLFLGVASAIALALGLGLVAPPALLRVDAARFGARGLIVEGMEGATGIVVFTLLLMGLVAVVEATGILERWLAAAERHIATRRGAEAGIVATLAGAALLTTHSVVAILAVGPFARRWGERHDIGPYRRANLLDVTSCTFPFLVPYCIPPILAASLAASAGGPALSPGVIGLHNTHSWALLLMVVLAVATGYGREREAGAPGERAEGHRLKG
jgi:Na+/H+ antiporter NhaC